MQDDNFEGYETATYKTNDRLEYYKYKNLFHDDGTAEGYSKDGLETDAQWIKSDFRIRPDGTPNLILQGYRSTIGLCQKGIQKAMSYDSKGKRAMVGGNSNFTMGLSNNLKKILSDNQIKIAPYINKLIEEDLIKKGLL